MTGQFEIKEVFKRDGLDCRVNFMDGSHAMMRWHGTDTTGSYFVNENNAPVFLPHNAYRSIHFKKEVKE